MFNIIDATTYLFYSIAVDLGLAFQFWRMARFEIFPAVLCIVLLGSVLFTIFALVVSFHLYWTFFGLNRIFELMLLYMIGCCIFRMRTRHQKDERKPPMDWRASFIAT